MPWDEFSAKRLERALERDPEWVTRRLLEIGVERGLIDHELAEELVLLGAEAEQVLVALLAGLIEQRTHR